MRFPAAWTLAEAHSSRRRLHSVFRAGGTALVKLQRSNVRQPIALNHAKHVENGVSCGAHGF